MPTLDTYRKQAKLLMRWHRDHDYSIGGRVRTLDRFRSLTDREILAMKFPLTLAQEIVAVEAGHRSWAELKVVAANALKTPVAPTEPPVFKSVVPILFVRDVTASAAFFRDKLGFVADFLHGAPPFYGAVSRDGIWIHLRLVHEPYFAAAAGCARRRVRQPLGQLALLGALLDPVRRLQAVRPRPGPGPRRPPRLHRNQERLHLHGGVTP